MNSAVAFSGIHCDLAPVRGEAAELLGFLPEARVISAPMHMSWRWVSQLRQGRRSALVDAQGTERPYQKGD